MARIGSRSSFFLISALLLLVGSRVVLSADIETGRKIYNDGIRADGSLLSARREGSGALIGQGAACVKCHRPSGLGMVEGNIVIPPISGRALFGNGERVTVRADRRFEPAVFLPHAPYDMAGFSRAVLSGQHLSGRPLGQLMPRYTLNEAELLSLAAYLDTLSSHWSPGANTDAIHLATVITPGLPTEKRLAFLDTLTAIVSQINVNVTSGLRQKISIIDRREHSRRKWALDVWELTGPSETWAEQLTIRQRENPVFAILSGLANDWQPVDQFCESQQVVCWFPSIDLTPSPADVGNYSLYFSRGTYLEADVAARFMARQPTTGRHLLQITSGSKASVAASNYLSDLANALGVTVKTIQITDDNLTDTLSSLQKDDFAMLWLTPDEVKRLSSVKPPTSRIVLVSGLLGGGEKIALAPAWRDKAHMIQPLEAPELREANLTRFSAWMAARKKPMIDQRMQSEVYFAANSLWFAMNGMLNNLHTDYLVERAENTLSMREAMLVQDEMQAMMMGGGGRGPTLPGIGTGEFVKDSRQHIEQMMRRRGTTAYPRLSLAIGQRIASQGAYIEKLAPGGGIVGEPEWIVP